MHLIMGPFSVMTLLAPDIPWQRTRPLLCSSYWWENKSYSSLFHHKSCFPVQMFHGISPRGEFLKEPEYLHCRGLKPYENTHANSAVEDNVTHSFIKQGRKEGHRLYSIKSHRHCLMPVFVKCLLPVLSHFSSLQTATKCWHQMS